MSDEPVRGAPSIDAFSVEKVENEAWSVRQFLVFLLILHPSQILSLSFFLHTSFRLDHTRKHTRLGGKFNLRACHSGDNLWFASDFFVDRGLFRIAICLRISGNFTSVIFVEKDFLRMAQTYNQKKNVYSIDQILGHGKDEGMIRTIFFFSKKRKLCQLLEF